jgi:hypothetical protein
MQGSVPQPVFLNVEFIFSWLWGNVISPIFSARFLSILQFLVSILIILGITIILYCMVRIYEIQQEDKKQKDTEKKETVQKQSTSTATSTPGALDLPGAMNSGPQSIPRNETWENIRSKLLSDSPSDWRLGIIEADIYMDRQFDVKGFYGDTVGDKLKNLTPEKLPSLQLAWEGHKVRNRIAHDGADFALTMPEARRVLSYYEIVFRDLGVIQ